MTASRARALDLVKLGLLLASVVVGMALMEGLSYAFGRFESLASPLEGGRIREVGRHDHDLFWSLRANYRDDTGLIETNSLGLRGPEVPGKSPGELRILSLGESSTFGARLALEQTYSARLEQMLGRDLPDRKTTVVNAGVPGYTTFQGLRYLESKGLLLEPEVVLFYFGYNDFLPVGFLSRRSGEDPEARGWSDRELFELRQGLSGRLRRFLEEHSNLYRGLARLAAERRRGGEWQARTDARRPRVPPEDREFLLASLVELCRREGVDLVIVIPWYREFEEHVPLLRSFAEENRVPLVDLPALLGTGGLPQPVPAYFVDEVHPNEAGHALIADAIRGAILELLTEEKGLRRPDA